MYSDNQKLLHEQKCLETKLLKYNEEILFLKHELQDVRAIMSHSYIVP